ncbi:MAG: caspase family protein [Deltaproteobacteria bacterium]|nr:caspase family protein [Deltaproteobacteria bacterium]
MISLLQKIPFLILCVLSALCGFCPDAAAAETVQAPATRRFALVVGSNDGGPGRVKLNYAVTDARAFSRVIEELGGVASRDRVVLTDPDVASFQAVLLQFGSHLKEARAAAARIEVLFYFSGHSDEQGLLFGKDRYPYSDLRKAVRDLPADVRVVILDSCSSGALTRAKGGVHKAPFLIDASSNVKGYAFLTSSSADEAAQESDRIKASFFTHYLVSGLRGAADTTGDGRVTLNEAYQYAFAETLQRTESTKSGAQHPAYDMQLAGSGDFVMTDLRDTSAKVVFGEDIGGRLYVRDEAGNLVVEVNKPRDRAVEVGLGPGTYTVTLDARGGLYRATMTLLEGRKALIGARQFDAVAGEQTALRGTPAGAVAVESDEYAPLGEQAGYHTVPLNVALVPPLSVNGSVAAVTGPDKKIVNNFSLNIIYGESARLHGIAVGMAHMVGESVEGVQMSLGFNYVGRPIRLFRPEGAAPPPEPELSEVSVTGAQLAFGFNYAGSGVHGVQWANGFNWGNGDVFGAQFATGFNWAGAQLSGVQFAAAFNVAKDDMRGVQAAAGFNWVHDTFAGAQLAAGFNRADIMTGGQLAAGANIADVIHGAQFALVNVAGTAGAQIGLVNVGSDVEGLQLGLVNVAEEVDGVSFALLPIVKNGYRRATLWGGDVHMVNMGVKLGSRHVYTVLGAGLSPDVSPNRWSAQFGLGGHVPLASGLFLDIDVVGAALRYGSEWDASSSVGSLRVMLGWEPAREAADRGKPWESFQGFGVYGGPTLNVFVSNRHDAHDFETTGLAHWTSNGGTTTRIWPGFVLGVQM